MNIIGKQTTENTLEGKYTVTFNANGGTIQGYGNAIKQQRWWLTEKHMELCQHQQERVIHLRVEWKKSSWLFKD